MKRTYTIQENGQVTLPAEWREKVGLKKGDVIVFRETEDGLLISPREALLMHLLDEIGDELQQRGVTLEDLLRDGRAIRTQLLEEKYGIDAGPEDE
ncbi:MAG: AbrB/MazE/SpoVT family DNA-binding domain-containing protein [Anaerolineae bacterium]|nr:AbrB/MazE/SpoVT family DNA-binding domain-containing protein [Anaerolineae bacterium]